MIVYPSVLPPGGRAFNFTSSRAYNPQNDIVLSVEYCISGNSNTEAGISFFISTDSSISGGVSGADLCYSGFYNGSLQGITTAVAGIGIDSTGVFGLSGTGRDGYNENSIIPNSIAARAGYSDYFALSTFGNYYRAISSFNIIDNNTKPKALRFRLGDVGRAMYLDYKNDLDGCYETIARVDIGGHLGVGPSTSTQYRIGVGFTTPISANNDSATANFYFKTVHCEGLVNSLNSIQPLLNFWENVLPLWPNVTESWSF
jgi:hypothetical protein